MHDEKVSWEIRSTHLLMKRAEPYDTKTQICNIPRAILPPRLDSLDARSSIVFVWNAPGDWVGA